MGVRGRVVALIAGSETRREDAGFRPVAEQRVPGSADHVAGVDVGAAG